MALWISYVKAWIGEQKGQDLVEYALLLGLIALVVVGAVMAGGEQVGLIWDAIETALTDAVAALP